MRLRSAVAQFTSDGSSFHLPKAGNLRPFPSHLPKVGSSMDRVTVSREVAYFHNELEYTHIEIQRVLFGHIRTCQKHTFNCK